MTDETNELQPELTYEEAEAQWGEQREEAMKKLADWKITYEFPEPFLQKDLQQFQTRLQKMRGSGDVARSVYNGIIIRVAIELGWIKHLTEKEIGEMHPGKVAYLSGRIFDDVVKAQLIPNE